MSEPWASRIHKSAFFTKSQIANAVSQQVREHQNIGRHGTTRDDTERHGTRLVPRRGELNRLKDLEHHLQAIN